jgi:hypothetical protein
MKMASLFGSGETLREVTVTEIVFDDRCIAARVSLELPEGIISMNDNQLIIYD